MIHAHKVRDRAGEATIWITEDIRQPRSIDNSSHATRVVWSVRRYNCMRIGVTIESATDLSIENAIEWTGDECDLTEKVPEDHLDYLKAKLRKKDVVRDTTIVFRDYEEKMALLA